jgi:threonine synthase
MKFNSTRGKVCGITFEEAIFMGYATDGGLLMPEFIPDVNVETLKKWSDLSYVDLCIEIWTLFIEETEISKKEIRGTFMFIRCISCTCTRLLWR